MLAVPGHLKRVVDHEDGAGKVSVGGKEGRFGVACAMFVRAMVWG